MMLKIQKSRILALFAALALCAAHGGAYASAENSAMYQETAVFAVGSTVTFETPTAVALVAYPPLAGRTVTLEFTGAEPQTVSAFFDAGGLFLNQDADAAYSGIVFPQEVDAAAVSVFTRIDARYENTASAAETRVFSDAFTTYNAANSRYDRANAVRGDDLPGDGGTVVAANGEGYWQRSDVSVGYINNPHRGVMLYIRTDATMQVAEQSGTHDGFVNLHVPAASERDLSRVTMKFARYNGVRASVRFCVSEDERTYYEAGILGNGDTLFPQPMSYRPYIRKVVDGATVDYVNGNDNFAYTAWYDMEITLDRAENTVKADVRNSGNAAMSAVLTLTDAGGLMRRGTDDMLLQLGVNRSSVNDDHLQVDFIHVYGKERSGASAPAGEIIAFLRNPLALRARIGGALETGIAWSVRRPDVAEMRGGALYGIREGDTQITASRGAETLTVKARVVSEYTYAAERGETARYFAQKRLITDALNAAVAAKDFAAMDGIITGSGDLSLQRIDIIDASPAAALKQTNPAAYADYLERVATYPAFSCAGLEDLRYLERVLADEIAVGGLNGLSAPEEVLAALREHNAVFGLTLGGQYYDGREAAVLSRLTNVQFKNVADVAKRFDEALLLTAFGICDTYQYMRQITTDFSGVIGYDAARLSALHLDTAGNRAFYTGLLQQKDTLQTIEDLKDFIDGFTPETPPVKPSSTGGKGGGGGGGGGFTLDPPPPAPVVPSDGTAVGKTLLYNDVPIDHWSYEATRYLTALGAVGGYEDGLFRPDGAITRAEFLKIVLTAFGEGAPETERESEPLLFEDVSVAAWYYGYVKAGVEAGIVYGDGANRFHPEREITRQEIAVLVVRALGNKGLSLPITETTAWFSDYGDIAEWAFDSVTQLQLAGIVSGRGNGAFAPNETATRAETAKMIYLSGLKGGAPRV
ncbi:MAG: S-layer homology domain-containing protein [Clostridiales bacterium]|jgi:hypothetical protein|nr:S-layer homology domain-containing protein [Clostridiales bacterium]